jgi:hypothetical protein
MSGPPQLKSLKKWRVVCGWGSAGAMSGPPQLKTSHGNARAPRVDSVNTASADSPVSAMAIAQT